MKIHIVIIGTVLILLILTAGCLDDLSSTLPPCCDGTCNMTKTSVIERSQDYGLESRYSWYTQDSDGILYGWPPHYVIRDVTGITSHYGRNVTFSYDMVKGHRHITGIIEDHDAKKPEGCCCEACCTRNCSCPHDRCGV